MSDTLLPCPFCKEQRIMHMRGDVGNLHWAFCKTCKAEGPVGMNWDEAICLWNNRPSINDQPKEN